MNRQLIQNDSEPLPVQKLSSSAQATLTVRLLGGLLFILYCSPIAIAQNDDNEDEPLPLFEEMSVPTTAQLLTEQPVDWLILKPDNRVLIVRPVLPRPDTLAQMANELEKLNSKATKPKHNLTCVVGKSKTHTRS